MIRTFIAIPLPEGNQTQLKDAVGSLRELDLNARFPDPRSIHLTLKFLGNIDETYIEEVTGVLDECCLSVPPFSVQLRGLGAFPHSARPRVLWMGVESGEELRELQQELENRLVALGFEVEERPFRPHLTVGRVKGKRNFKALVQFLRSEKDDFEAGSFQVNSVSLYQSVLKPTGAEYSVLHRASLLMEHP